MLVILSHTRNAGHGQRQTYQRRIRSFNAIRCPDCSSRQWATGATAYQESLWGEPTDIEECYCKECGKSFFLEWVDRSREVIPSPCPIVEPGRPEPYRRQPNKVGQ